MKFYVEKLLENTAEQFVPSVSVYDTESAARVNYHNILAAYHNAADVLYAVVLLQEENGNVIDKEIVDHIPEPEPEPEPEEEETPEEEVPVVAG